MKKLTIVLCTTLIGSSLVCTSSALADDEGFLKDASFENQLAPSQGGWELFEESTFSNDQARSGEQSMLNAGFSRTVTYQPYFVGTVSGSFQEFQASPGSRWRLAGYGLTPSELQGTPAFGVLQLSFFDADGKDLGTVETADTSTRAKTSAEVNNQSPVGEWILLDTGVATAPEGTATVQAFTIYVDYSGSNRLQGVFFDDLRLCALDENEDEESSLCDPG